MDGRHEGHPLGATLIIAAIFSVALAFHLAQPPAPSLPARATIPMVMHAAAVSAHPATHLWMTVSTPKRLPQAASSVAAPTPMAVPVPQHAAAEPVLDTTVTLPAGTPALAAFSWSSVPTAYPATVQAATRAEAPVDRGAVTHAFASAGNAVRTAFKKAF